MADLFYDEFRNTTLNVEKDLFYYKKLHSVVIFFKDGSGFTIPGYFYYQLSRNASFNISHLILIDQDWSDLISSIFDYTLQIPFNLQSSDVKILQALSEYKGGDLINEDGVFLNGFDFMTPFVTIQNQIDHSLKWIRIRDQEMRYTSVVTHMYFLNSAYLLLHGKNEDYDLLNSLTLMYLPFDKQILRIIQLPKYKKNNSRFKQINEMTLLNNLNNLNEGENNSFKNIPEYTNHKEVLKPNLVMKESNSSWSSNLSFLKIKKYPHLEKQGIQQRFLIINFVIEAIIKYYSLNATILKQISTDEKVDFYLLTDALKFILDNNVVVYHTRLTRIGSSNRYGLYILDETSDESKKMEELYNNLLKLPQSYVFKGNNMLFAYVTMSDNYINPFFRYLTLLKKELIIKYEMFVALKSWGKYNITFPEGSELHEEGVVFPESFMEKIDELLK